MPWIFKGLVDLNPSWKSTGSFKVNRRLKLPCEVWSLIPEEISSTAGVQFHAKWLGHDSKTRHFGTFFWGGWEIRTKKPAGCVERSPSPALYQVRYEFIPGTIALAKLHSAQGAPPSHLLPMVETFFGHSRPHPTWWIFICDCCYRLKLYRDRSRCWRSRQWSHRCRRVLGILGRIRSIRAHVHFSSSQIH